MKSMCSNRVQIRLSRCAGVDTVRSSPQIRSTHVYHHPRPFNLPPLFRTLLPPRTKTQEQQRPSDAVQAEGIMQHQPHKVPSFDDRCCALPSPIHLGLRVVLLSCCYSTFLCRLCYKIIEWIRWITLSLCEPLWAIYQVLVNDLSNALPMSTEDVTYIYREHYPYLSKKLPTLIENITYICRKHYLRLMKTLSTSAKNVTYGVNLWLVKNLPTGERESVTAYLYEKWIKIRGFEIW